MRDFCPHFVILNDNNYTNSSKNKITLDPGYGRRGRPYIYINISFVNSPFEHCEGYRMVSSILSQSYYYYLKLNDNVKTFD